MKIVLSSALIASIVLSVNLVTAQDDPNDEVLIVDVPHIRQKPDFCGEACAAMMLNKLGMNIDQDAIFDLTQVDPTQGRGAYTAELNNALRRVGFNTGSVWYPVNPQSSTADISGHWKALHHDLKRGVASIVCMHYDDQPNTTEHNTQLDSERIAECS